ELLQGGSDVAFPVGLGGLRYYTANQSLGMINQHSGWFVGCIPANQTAIRIGGIASDLRQVQHFGIHPRRMTVDALQDDWVISAHRVEFLGRGKVWWLPKTLVPATAGYPSSRWG